MASNNEARMVPCRLSTCQMMLKSSLQHLRCSQQNCKQDAVTGATQKDLLTRICISDL